MRSVAVVAVDVSAVEGVAYGIGAVVICYMLGGDGAVAMVSRCISAGEIVHYRIVVYDGGLMQGGDSLSSAVDIPLTYDCRGLGGAHRVRGLYLARGCEYGCGFSHGCARSRHDCFCNCCG